MENRFLKSIVSAILTIITYIIYIFIAYAIVYYPHRYLLVGFSKLFSKIFGTPILYEQSKYFTRISVLLMIINCSIIYNISLISDHNKQLQIIGIYLGAEIIIWVWGGLSQIDEDNRINSAMDRYRLANPIFGKKPRKTKQSIEDEKLLRKYNLI